MLQSQESRVNLDIPSKTKVGAGFADALKVVGEDRKQRTPCHHSSAHKTALIQEATSQMSPCFYPKSLDIEKVIGGVYRACGRD
ncbi:hypothetical protein BKA70DRAFT_764844 [Coprinopsis sp. MPI-PUGE-AT-0042]|nr:hypothetical protein BKA70DRAFT_764844 [Coprinopsis sp. MPI-PUGE-AT-0042]